MITKFLIIVDMQNVTIHEPREISGVLYVLFKNKVLFESFWPQCAMVAFCEAAHFCTFCICASCKHNLKCRIFFLPSSIYKVKHIEFVAAGACVCFLIKMQYKIPSHGLITHCSIAPYAVIKFTALCLYVLLLTKRGIQKQCSNHD